MCPVLNRTEKQTLLDDLHGPFRDGVLELRLDEKERTFVCVLLFTNGGALETSLPETSVKIRPFDRLT